VDIVTSVVDLARTLGLVVEEPRALRSTNNLVLWLRPSPVVAKISFAGNAAGALAVARALAGVGAPIVPPAEDIGHRVYRVCDRQVTFWRYAPQDAVDEPGPKPVAGALFALHQALATVGGPTDRPPYAVQITDAVRALDRPGFAPELGDGDRRLLRRTLSEGLVGLGARADRDHTIHGSPHRLNILVLDGSPNFIDFETVQRGPREWDLAHLEPNVSDHYPGMVDADVLARCRILVSATISTWCWDGLERGPDMRGHAQHHLDVVRSALPATDGRRSGPEAGDQPGS
jgi:hypothetical protein